MFFRWFITSKLKPHSQPLFLPCADRRKNGYENRNKTYLSMNMKLLVSFELTLAGIGLLPAGNHPPMCGPKRTQKKKETMRK